MIRAVATRHCFRTFSLPARARGRQMIRLAPLTSFFGSTQREAPLSSGMLSDACARDVRSRGETVSPHVGLARRISRRVVTRLDPPAHPHGRQSRMSHVKVPVLASAGSQGRRSNRRSGRDRVSSFDPRPARTSLRITSGGASGDAPGAKLSDSPALVRRRRKRA